MKTFEEAWAEYEAKGYQYGEDALEQVRFGWDIAAAAVEAAKQSGDLVSREEDPGYTYEGSLHMSFDNIMKRGNARLAAAHTNPTPPTENKDEREQLLEDAINDLVDCYPQLDSNSIVDSQDDAARQVLLALYNKISDAADKAGYERGRAEGFEHGRKERDRVLTVYLEQQEKIEDMATQVREFQDRCNADVVAEQAKNRSLQSQHKRLYAAARELQLIASEVHAKLTATGSTSFSDRASLGGACERAYAALAETLPETEEKKT